MSEINNILLITAHCDDAEIWAGGTIHKLITEGKKVFVGICEYNDKRKKETLQSSSLLGYSPIFKQDDIEIANWISDLITKITPKVLLFHPSWDPHPQHQDVFRATIEAMRLNKNRKKYPLRWYVFDTYYLTNTSSSIPVIVDISDSYLKKENAISFHKTQNTKELIHMIKNINQIHGLKIRTEYAEAFYPIDILGRIPKLRENI